jgi:hypothetical protein
MEPIIYYFGLIKVMFFGFTNLVHLTTMGRPYSPYPNNRPLISIYFLCTKIGNFFLSAFPFKKKNPGHPCFSLDLLRC